MFVVEIIITGRWYQKIKFHLLKPDNLVYSTETSTLSNKTFDIKTCNWILIANTCFVIPCHLDVIDYLIHDPFQWEIKQDVVNATCKVGQPTREYSWFQKVFFCQRANALSEWFRNQNELIHVTFQSRPRSSNLFASALLSYGLQKCARNWPDTAIQGLPSSQGSCT